MTQTGATTLDRIAAIARRDARVQLTYHFQLVTRNASLVFVLFTYFFIGRLVTDTDALAPYGGGYFDFVLVGLIVTTFAVVAMSAFSATITSEQQSGTLEILLASAVPLPTLLAGSLVVPTVLAAGQALVLGGVGWAVSDSGIGLEAVLLALPLLLLTFGTFCALGIVSAALIVLTKRGDIWSGVVLQLTSLVAGAVFPVSVLPEPLQLIARLFPAFYGFEGLRAVLLSGHGFTDVLDELAILAAFNLLMFPAALWAFRRALRVARVTGTLGND